jgi:hypothetical protein
MKFAEQQMVPGHEGYICILKKNMGKGFFLSSCLWIFFLSGESLNFAKRGAVKVGAIIGKHIIDKILLDGLGNGVWKKGQ